MNALFVSSFTRNSSWPSLTRARPTRWGSARLLFYVLLFLTSVTAVGAFDAVGAILFIAFVIVPPAAAYLLTDRLWLVLLGGAALAVVASVAGFHAGHVAGRAIWG